MNALLSRRDWLLQAGISASAANLVLHLPSLCRGGTVRNPTKQRLIVVFSPNGVIPDHFWPEGQDGELQLKRIMEPLAPFRHRLITMEGLGNRIKGDGDGHMRGIGCLLTGIELFPGDIQGGSDTPAGWSQGISVDQFLKNRFQADPLTQTRFGSLEFGVMVPKRADTWTRMSYSGPNQPVTPIDNPYRMFEKLYGQTKDRELLASVLDELTEDFHKVERMIGQEDRRLLQDHLEMVRQVERELQVCLLYTSPSPRD